MAPVDQLCAPIAGKAWTRPDRLSDFDVAILDHLARLLAKIVVNATCIGAMLWNMIVAKEPMKCTIVFSAKSI
jgi:hypothetical protein